MDDAFDAFKDFATWVFNPGYAAKKMVDELDDMLTGGDD